MPMPATPPPRHAVPRAAARPAYASGTLAKGLQLLEAVLADGGRSGLSAIARQLEMPVATAHRLARTLESAGYIDRAAKGIYVPGQRLAAFGRPDPRDRLAAVLRHPLARLARRFGAYAHAGVLEDNMVTYIVRERGGALDLFTVEHMQLEAYCSAIGKVLLAALPDAELDAYLDQGPFIALTPNTITDPDRLRATLLGVRRDGAAYDRHEVRSDLYCMAVPVHAANGAVRGAISLSFLGDTPTLGAERSALRSLRSLAGRARAD